MSIIVLLSSGFLLCSAQYDSDLYDYDDGWFFGGEYEGVRSLEHVIMLIKSIIVRMPI